jgi:hypothetical protein
MLEPAQPVRVGVSLAGFAQQFLGRPALPRVRLVGTRHWAHTNVHVAVLEHALPSTAEDPRQQRTLDTASGLLHRVPADLELVGGEFQTDQVPRGEQRGPIPLFVDVIAGISSV